MTPTTTTITEEHIATALEQFSGYFDATDPGESASDEGHEHAADQMFAAVGVDVADVFQLAAGLIERWDDEPDDDVSPVVEGFLLGVLAASAARQADA